MPPNQPKYWAQGTNEQIAAAVPNLKGQYWQALERRGVLTLQRLIYAQSFGISSSGRGNRQMMQFCGQQASFIRFRVARARALTKRRMFSAMGERPSFGTQALNSDTKSMAQVGIAKSMIDYVFRRAGGEDAYYLAMESAMYLGSGFVWHRWDPDAGDVVPYQAEVGKFPDGSPITEQQDKLSGLPEYSALYPWQVTLPIYDRSNKPPWVIVHEVRDKNELLALNPDLDDAVNAPASMTIAGQMPFAYDVQLASGDYTIVDHVYIANSRAVPGGKYVCCVGGKVLFGIQSPLAQGVPVVPIRPSLYFGTNVSYPESADQLAIDEMRDMLLSNAANSYARFGNQNLYGPPIQDSGIDLSSIAQGGRYIPIQDMRDIPKAVQWAALPEGFSTMMGTLTELQNDVSGQNPTSLGDPGREISGVAMQTLINQARRFGSADERAYNVALERGGEITLELVRKNAVYGLIAEVSGKSSEPYLEYFTNEPLAGVKRVTVNRQSPVLDSPAGRWSLLEMMKNFPTRQERLGVARLMADGDPSALIEQETSTVNLIEYENAELSAGRPVAAKDSDDARLHNESHRSKYDRERTKPGGGDPRVLKVFEDHMLDHALKAAAIPAPLAATFGLPPGASSQPPSASTQQLPPKAAPPPGAKPPPQAKPLQQTEVQIDPESRPV